MRHSKFFLLDQEPKYKNLSEKEFIKESTSDGHLLGSHAILSPQSRPSSPVNTRLQPLAAGNVLGHLQRFGQKLQVSGTVGTPRGFVPCWNWQALSPSGDVPAALLAPACLAPPAGPARQKDSTHCIGEALCLTPPALVFFCIRYPHQFPGAFERPGAQHPALRSTPTCGEFGQWAPRPTSF